MWKPQVRVFARFVPLTALVAIAAGVLAQEASKTSEAQSVADALAGAASTQIAFVPQGVLSSSSGDLSARVQYPTDTVAVVVLSGAQIRAALERGVSLYPTPNPAFLYVSGLEYTFGEGPAGSRVQSVTVGGQPLQPTAKYRVAMPGNVAKGGLGFFTVWERAAIDGSYKGPVLESALRGRPVIESAPRWHRA